MRIVRTVSQFFLITLLLGALVQSSSYHQSHLSGQVVAHSGDRLDEELVDQHLLTIDPLTRLSQASERFGQQFAQRPAGAALDFFTTVLQLAIFGYNAVAAQQPQFVEKPVATANVLHRFPPMFSRELRRSFVASGTVEKAIRVRPLKGPTGYTSADDKAESFKEELEADIDAGGGPPTDWIEVEIDGVRQPRAEREIGKSYLRTLTISYKDVEIGKRRVTHWRSSQERGSKTVMSIYTEPTSLADLNSQANLKARWPVVIQHAAGVSADREGRVPFVLQGDGLASRITVRVLDTKSYRPNEPNHQVSDVTLAGYEPAEPVWVKPGLVRLRLIKDSSDPRKAFADPAPDKRRLDGGLAYDVSNSTAASPFVVKLRSTSYKKGGE